MQCGFYSLFLLSELQNEGKFSPPAGTEGTINKQKLFQCTLGRLKDHTSVTTCHCPLLTCSTYRLHKPHTFFPQIALSMRYHVCLHFVYIP